jgi:hypothetical protein
MRGMKSSVEQIAVIKEEIANDNFARAGELNELQSKLSKGAAAYLHHPNGEQASDWKGASPAPWAMGSGKFSVPKRNAGT